ncbi:hypothetical protein B0T14DRAFT_595878 [Immersiella caudata]|uniref:Uncharacterized protein n=1 Tax=Immersiella caudata TaxID=314043 RepID=A0AA39WAM0_9PEZI|nr:hypothetical protein B0T14DRAFT_595878 [Immersiella caudata]
MCSSTWLWLIKPALFSPLTQGATVDTSTGALSSRLVHLFPLAGPVEEMEVDNGRNTHLFRSSTRHAEIWFASTVGGLDKLADDTTDHVFFAGSGTPLLLRKHEVNGHNAAGYKIVAPLQTIYIAFDLGRDHKHSQVLGLCALLRSRAVESLKKSPPLWTTTGDVTDPFLERFDPLARQRRDTRTATRLRRQFFPGAALARDTHRTLQKLVIWAFFNFQYGGNDDRRSDLDRTFAETNAAFMPPGSIGSRVLTSPVGHVEFHFPPAHFGYVTEWYCAPLFSPDEDPDGVRRQEEENLFEQMIPVWQWRARDGRWVDIQDRPQGMGDLQNHMDKVQNTGTGEAVVLRARASSVLACLVHFTWEVEVIKRLKVSFRWGWFPGPGEAFADGMGRFFGIFSLTKRGTARNPEMGMAKAWKDGHWPPRLVRDLGVDGRVQSVTIF